MPGFENAYVVVRVARPDFVSMITDEHPEVKAAQLARLQRTAFAPRHMSS